MSLKVISLWNYKGHTGNAIVDFSKDWAGFKDAMAFESYFEANHLSKKDWYGRKSYSVQLAALHGDAVYLGSLGYYIYYLYS